MRVLTFVPRFVSPADLAELSNLWHLARVACQPHPTRYARMIWASAEFAKLHPEVSATAVYKDLGDMLDFGGR